MAHIIADLRTRFKSGNITIRLIYINVAVFLVFSLIRVGYFLFNNHIDNVSDCLSLPASFPSFLNQPWSLITFMFMHSGFWHILFNMLCLYWFGELFLMTFSEKHLRGLYVFGGICGGVLYMLSYNFFPCFQTILPSSLLLGASASVMAIIFATAYRSPNYSINLFLFGSVRLKYMALGLVIIDLLFIAPYDGHGQLNLGNAGGHISHLGGALAGLWFAAALNKGIDLTAWINTPVDWICSLFRFKRGPRKAKMKIYRGKKGASKSEPRRVSMKEIDRILDKIKRSGYQSLTDKEKNSLFDASKK